MSNLYGLIGEKLGHSISPKIHSIIFKKLDIDGCYHLFEISRENLRDGICGLKAIGAKGVNVTIPYKIDIMNYLDEISPEASAIGAVNTIYFYDNKIVGFNTDYMGFGMMLKRNHVEIEKKKFVILGTGGASKSVLKFLLNNGAEDVILVSRDVNGAKNHIGKIGVITYNDVISLKGFDTVINCTPCGMSPNTDFSPVDRDTIGKFTTAVDLIYNPKQTLFLKYAGEQGIKTVNGLYMLIGQAVAAQEIWNNRELGLDFIDKIYDCFV